MRKIVRFEKLEYQIRKQLINMYPDGFDDALIRIDGPKPFHAVLFDADDATYLVKLNTGSAVYLDHMDDNDDDDSEDFDSEDLEVDEDEDDD